ncbi:MAG: hypothetical protein GY820_30745 [Gammaproteobacteria bacterium]|nr:hypothetical protein [Gammaproteobacteria bacterium]
MYRQRCTDEAHAYYVITQTSNDKTLGNGFFRQSGQLEGYFRAIEGPSFSSHQVSSFPK